MNKKHPVRNELTKNSLLALLANILRVTIKN